MFVFYFEFLCTLSCLFTTNNNVCYHYYNQAQAADNLLNTFNLIRQKMQN